MVFLDKSIEEQQRDLLGRLCFVFLTLWNPCGGEALFELLGSQRIHLEKILSRLAKLWVGLSLCYCP